MIIEAAILTIGKECLEPKPYVPIEETFKMYAHYYQRGAEELYKDILASTEVKPDLEELSSEEREDNEIRATDRLALSLVVDENDTRLDTYVFDINSEAFYVHHDVFLHGVPTSMTVWDRAEDPIAFIGNQDGHVTGYNLFVTNHFLPDLAFAAHESPITSIKSNSTFILTTDQKSIKAWDLATQKPLFASTSITPLQIAVNDQATVFADTNTVYNYDHREKKPTKLFSTTTPITSLSLLGGSVAAGTTSGDIFVTKDQAVAKTYSVHKESINNLQLTTDRYVVSSSRDETIALFDLLNEEVLLRTTTNIDTAKVAVPLDDPTIFVFPQEDGELGIDSFADAISLTE
ncbi:hypothetical protein NEHOM01_1957 [Nematocida homosporus]|uniref:uncharacterized protein n=1 Tax=Nematocida homosporus TaxID=1912981 RepID=UPI00221E4058|nr:uncharacterized protein NEHOM01_1957 [Nematocida homosporus]KAI5187131.1 hypothetical protein NEHOM01_1957 [Nematocida homosporus]